MKRELVTTDAFEKKKSHVAWFTLVLVTIILAFDGTPIKFPGIDSSIPPLPAIAIIAAALAYMLLTFWLESRKVIRLNSKFVAGKDTDDTIAEISSSLDKALTYLEEVSKFSFGPSPIPVMKDALDQYRGRAENYLKYLRELQSEEGGFESTGEAVNFRTAEAARIQSLIGAQETFLAKLSSFPFDEFDPVVAAAEGQRKLRERIEAFQSQLDTDIKSLSADLKRLSDEILTEGKVQWGVERWPPLLVGCVTVFLACIIIVWPEQYSKLRANMISNSVAQSHAAETKPKLSGADYSAAGR